MSSRRPSYLFALVVAASLIAIPSGYAQRTAATSDTAFASLPDTAKVLRLNAEAWAVRRTDAARTITIASRSLALARRIGFRRGEAQVLNYLGVGYQWLGDNKTASRYFFQALGVADSAGIANEKGYALNNIAALLLFDDEGAQALTYAQRALALQEAARNEEGIAYAHSRLSEISNAMGRYDDAIVHATAAYERWTALHITSTSLTALRNLALAYEGKKQYPLALARLLEIMNSDSLPAGTRLHDYSDLARVYLKLHRPDDAIATGLRKVAAGEGDVEILRYLAEAYAAKGDWKHAFAYSQRAAVVQDSVAKQTSFRQAENLQFLYESARRDAENVTLQHQLRFSRYLVALAAVIIVLVTYVGLTHVQRRRQQERANTLLAEQLAKTEASEAELRVTTNALVESWQHQRAILDNAPDAMWVQDALGVYTAVNDRFTRTFHRQSNEIVGQSARDVMPPDLAQRVADLEASAIAARRPESAEHESVLDGATRQLEVTVSPVFDADGALLGTTGVARDVTERKRNEEHRRQAQALQSLSVLAGGVAHDFNNLLQSVLGNAEFARLHVSADSPVAQSLNEIGDAARRAALLTRQMAAYAGDTLFSMQDIDLSEVVAETVETLRSGMSSHLALQLERTTDASLLRADAGQVRQVVTNLVMNAADAIGTPAGTIVVRTERVYLTAEHLSQMESADGAQAGPYVAIEVSDTGPGMTAETMRRIFDPFFTTKFVGRGLGLAAVLGIVRGHHGAIEVRSTLGEGSQFRVHFPAPVQHVSTAKPRGEDASDRAGTAPHPEIILVVDDEEAVRNVAYRVLNRAGFTVLTAADGMEGVESVHQHRADIALVLLDMQMPRLDGEHAMRAMRALEPTLPILFTSGFSGEAVGSGLLADRRVGFLAKPFRNHELIAAVRALLDSRGA